MKIIAVTHKGFEEITKLEIKEILNVDSIIKERCVLFNLEKIEDACILSYSSQSIRRVMILLKDFEIFEPEDIDKNIIDIKFDEFLKNEKTFSVRCVKDDDYDFHSRIIEEKIGGYVHEKYNNSVNLSNPDIEIIAYISANICYICIDICGFDLSKRTYNLFSHPASLKGTISYSLLRLADYKPGLKLIDPFCKSGSIIIEAGLYNIGKSVNFYNKDKFNFEKMDMFNIEKINEIYDNKDIFKEFKGKITGYDNLLRNVKSSQKNAKVAGINKEVSFLRGDVEWLDTKFDEKEIDLVISYPPQISNKIERNYLLKLFKELFYHLEFIMKKKGKVLLVNTHEKEIMIEPAKEYKFLLINEHEFYQGKEHFTALIFQKS
jgi:23S rRNA G2445 N2-methylase RlmL